MCFSFVIHLPKLAYYLLNFYQMTFLFPEIINIYWLEISEILAARQAFFEVTSIQAVVKVCEQVVFQTNRLPLSWD